MKKSKEIKSLLQLKESFDSREEYDSASMLNYSLIKDINDNPAILEEGIPEKRTNYLDLGTLVDTLLLNEQNFYDKIMVVNWNNNEPSKNIKKIIETIVLEGQYKRLEDITQKDAVRLFSMIGSLLKWSPKAKRENIIKKGSLYYDMFKKAKDKIIVDKLLFDKASQLATKTKGHPWTYQYFQDNDKFVNAYKIAVVLKNVEVKCEIDKILIDSKRKILYPIDIKTGSPSPKGFLKNFFKYKGYYQGGLYRRALSEFLKKELPELRDYRIGNFKFLFISTTNFIYPTIWRMTEKDHTTVWHGWHDRNKNYNKGLSQLLEDAKYYFSKLSVGEPLQPIDLEKSNGEIDINII